MSKTPIKFNFDKFEESEAELDSLIHLDKEKKKKKVSSKTTTNFEKALTSIASSKTEDQKWGADYLKLHSSLKDINTEIEELFGGTLTDEALDEFFALQSSVFGKEYNTSARHGVQDEFFKEREAEPDIFPDIASGVYQSGEKTHTEGGWGVGTVSGKSSYALHDESLYLSYADKILNDPKSSEDLRKQAAAFKNYSQDKLKLEDLEGHEIPHYVIPPGPDHYGSTRVNPRELNLTGTYAGGMLYEGETKNTLWDFPKMRDLDFVKKHGATSGIFGGGDPIESLAKDKGLKGVVFEDWFGNMGDAHAFAEYVKKSYSKDKKEYSEKYNMIFGDNKSGASSVTLDDGTEVKLDDLRDNMSVLKKLYGQKEGVMNLLLELEATNK